MSAPRSEAEAAGSLIYKLDNSDSDLGADPDSESDAEPAAVYDTN